MEIQEYNGFVRDWENIEKICNREINKKIDFSNGTAKIITKNNEYLLEDYIEQLEVNIKALKTKIKNAREKLPEDWENYYGIQENLYYDLERNLYDLKEYLQSFDYEYYDVKAYYTENEIYQNILNYLYELKKIYILIEDIKIIIRKRIKYMLERNFKNGNKA